MSDINDVIKEWGLKLLFLKIKMAGGSEEFFRQCQIYKWNPVYEVSHCTKVYKDVLWMRFIEANTNFNLLNGCKLPVFISFFSDIRKYYRFRDLTIHKDYIIENMDEFIKSRPWSYHTFRKDDIKNGNS